MEEYRRNGQEGKAVFVGVDLHRFKWHVTVRTNSNPWCSVQFYRLGIQTCTGCGLTENPYLLSQSVGPPPVLWSSRSPRRESLLYIID
jgi:hypothetical protein